MTPKHWLALVGLTFATFIFNTSEFIPIGLLTDIATDFHMTEAHAGMLISVYAWVVMLLSLPLMLVYSSQASFASTAASRVSRAALKSVDSMWISAL